MAGCVSIAPESLQPTTFGEMDLELDALCPPVGLGQGGLQGERPVTLRPARQPISMRQDTGG
jgi:hypothetical protein